MRILVFCNKLPYPAKDGGAVALRNMIQGYYQADIDVTVLALNTHKHYYPVDAIPAEDVLSKVELHTVSLNTNVTITGIIRNLFTRESYHASRFRDKRVAKKIGYLLKAKAFDIVQLEQIHLSTYLRLIRQCSAAKVVLRAHNVEHLLWERVSEEARNPLKRFYLKIQTNRLKRFEANYLPGFDAILPIKSADGEYFRTMGFKGPVQTIPIGLPLKAYTTHTDGGSGKAVFHLGAMDWLPNQEGVQWFLKYVWPEVVRDVPEAYLALAGRNMPAELNNDLPPQVSVLGEVDDAKTFMAGRDIMIVPLHSGSGVRIKILEGMALGKAIVSTTLGAEGLQVYHDQELLMADTARTFAAALKACLTSPDYQRRLGKKARETLERTYDLNRVAKNAAGFLSNLSDSH